MFNSPSNYIIAGADCFTSILDTYLNKHGGTKYLSHEVINRYLGDTVNKYLYSFGTGISYKKQKVSKNHSAKISKQVTYIKSQEFMRDSKLYIDSGGFQVAMGAVKSEDMPKFVLSYKDFILENLDNIDHAFSLDLPPGPDNTGNVFKNYAEIESLNRLSYQTFQEFEQPVKDKIVYIHHFRTPSLFKTWNKFLWEENLAEGFTHFATGGIVANMATDMTIPIIIYAIPLSDIVRYCKSKNITKFNFHVLGGANYVDVFYHKLFSHHIKEYHGLDVTITYDSSAIFKALTMGRFIPTFNADGDLIKMTLKSSSLHLRFDREFTIDGKVKNIMSNFDEYGFGKIDPSVTIYDMERNTFSRDYHIYLTFYYLYLYRQLEDMSEKLVKEVYPLYKQGNISEFDNICYDFAQRLNGGKRTKKVNSKISSLERSLKLLERLDPEENQYLIEKFMYDDDMGDLGKGVLPIIM